MLLDANVLIYAADLTSPHHPQVRGWLEAVMNGQRRVGFPWPTLTAFLRIVTHPGPWQIRSPPPKPGRSWTTG